MNDPRIGSLFTGYGGLDMAVRAALGGGHTVWHSDIKPASIALLEHRHPEVPNLGNLKLIHWPRTLRAHGPIDVLAASWPCQPHSSAGKRLGEADPRALWPDVARAIAATRPSIFFGENVARITSNGELRRVVRSLADLGYVGAWRVLSASDVHAAHKRARCFVVAVRADAAHLERVDRLARGLAAQPGGGANSTGRLTLLPTPTQSMTTGAGTSGREGGLNLQTAVTLLPTPTVTDARGGRNATAGRSDPGSNHHSGWTLTDVAYAGRFSGALLPTPKASDGEKGGPGMRGSSGDLAMPSAAVLMANTWGVYAEAIARWGCAFDREAPAPTQPGRSGAPRLAPPFVEWMMGLPEGWVCDVPDLAPRANGHRNAALSLLGDGVVPQQGAAAFRFLLAHLAERLAVAA